VFIVLSSPWRIEPRDDYEIPFLRNHFPLLAFARGTASNGYGPPTLADALNRLQAGGLVDRDNLPTPLETLGAYGGYVEGVLATSREDGTPADDNLMPAEDNVMLTFARQARSRMVRAPRLPRMPASMLVSTPAINDRPSRAITDLAMTTFSPPSSLEPAAANNIDAGPRDAAMCDVCGHPVDGHDRIAERYCQATLDNALSRTCICSTHGSAPI